MGYIYRYTDLSDSIIKYVGIVWGKSRALGQRLKEHERDSWYRGTKWRIEYICAEIDTRTDAEYFESHYISLYGTDKYFNIAKSGWGISQYLPDREDEWKEYDDNDLLGIVSPITAVNKLLSYKSYDKRKHFYMSLSNHLQKNKNAKAYKDEMNKQLNNLLFEKNTYIARFNGYGEILVKFNGFGEIRYVDYQDSFISPFDGTLIKSNEFVSHIKRNFENYYNDTIGIIKSIA